MSHSTVAGGDEYAQFDAAYLLGALSPGDRSDYEAHLLTCAQCRSALAQAATVVSRLAGTDEGVLDLASAEPAVGPTLPDTVLPAVLASAELSRRRTRQLVTGLGGVAAASLVAVAVLGYMVAGGRPTTTSSGPGPGTVVSSADGAVWSAARTMTAVGNAPVTAQVALLPTRWGTEIDLTCWYRSSAHLPAGYRYVLMVRDTRGVAYQLGSWQLDSGGRVNFSSGTALSLDQISAIDITDSYGSRLLTLTK